MNIFSLPSLRPSAAWRAAICSFAVVVVLLASTPSIAEAQTRILFVGDSITQGGQGYASYRYPLYFDLLVAGYDVDFVGSRDFPHNSVTPQPVLYPDYAGTFDRDHEGYWGWRTDQVETVVQNAALNHQPEIVVIHLGTNDIGQQGASGVTNADTNLRDIIGLVRTEVPTATFLLSRIIPLGPGAGGSYGVNSAQGPALNAAIDGVAAALDTLASPIVVVDPNLGFDLNTMMQGDQIHPNELGEQWIADVFQTALEAVLPPGNPAPSVALTAPADGTVVIAPPSLQITAAASDVNGTVAEVRFFVNGVLLGVDEIAPFTFDWQTPAPGSYSLTAVAEDDQGATRTSTPVALSILPAGSSVPIAVVNSSFELPAVADSSIQNNSGIPGWTFTGTAATFRGIFNPPAGSYPEAAGQGTPIGADGAQVAFLFNNGGPAESVSLRQDVADTLVAGRDYTLRVAVGKFDPNQPYPPAGYGGYRIELLAGDTVIASDVDTQDPPLTEFRDAILVAGAGTLNPSLIGEPLAIRIELSSVDAQRSTHFDDVRLEWSPAILNAPPTVQLVAPLPGSVSDAGQTVVLDATATDTDGTVTEVRFFAEGVLIGTDSDEAFSFDWTPNPGTYELTAVAVDDQGATTTSGAVSITVLPAVSGGSIAIVNASFELPTVGDSFVQNDSGISGWTFTGTASTYRGVFNPPAGSYPEAAGQGAPIGADGAQVAFLFNIGGVGESVSARQDLSELVVAGRDYTLRVAVGKFDPNQPYSPSSYGGYRIELLAGETVIATDSAAVDPPLRTFVDAVTTVGAADIPASLLGLPLAVRLALAGDTAERSTHFDEVRLDWQASNEAPTVAWTSPTSGTEVEAGVIVPLVATAADVDGNLGEVRFFQNGSLVGIDDETPFQVDWQPATAGLFQLSAMAVDDRGAVAETPPILIIVLPPVASGTVDVVNPSFEQPAVGDSFTQNDSGIPGWTFTGTASTFRGIFNPPAGSYPEAAGQGTPIGADGAQAAFLFNNGGPAESVSARQVLAEVLVGGRDYTLEVAVGHFDPSQPYAPSTYGGYRIELLAGNTVLASNVDSITPALRTFDDAVIVLDATAVPPALVGEPLAIRLQLSSTAAQRSTHFDDVRLSWQEIPGNVPAAVTLDAPSSAQRGAVVPLSATAMDADGTVVEVRFLADGLTLGVDNDAPFTFDWMPTAAGSITLVAEAEDDQGATTVSTPVTVIVTEPPTADSVAIVNASFETPMLADSQVQSSTGVPGWTFTAVGATYRGIFNPPAASYPEAAVQGTPIGADGAQVAFLFNNGGPSSSVSVRQDLAETLVAGRDYTLRVAVGHFDPSQPYAPSTYGGYRIELLAGDTVLVSDVDSIIPLLHTFQEVTVTVDASSVPPALVGQSLAVRLGISADETQRSTHFDNVRLEWSAQP